jgi:rod shape-determining protein MreC
LRNIFLFIRRYFTFICFLALQAASLWFLFNYNRFHRARGLGFANQVTGWFNTRYNKVEDFVSRGEETRRVHRMNDSLVNLLNGNFLKKDSGSRVIIDTVVTDTVNRYRRYLERCAGRLQYHP